MYKVFVVDDEKWVRLGLKKMIKWNELNLEFVGEALDGEDALSEIETIRPDILITDVRMPSMDGLSLSEFLLQNGYKMQVIIISGYNEFDYVQRSINFDAISYILKPINKKHLNKMLEKAIGKLDRERKTNEFEQNIDEILSNAVLHTVVSENQNYSQSINQWLKNMNIKMLNYCIAVIQSEELEDEFKKVKSVIKKRFNLSKRFFLSLFCKHENRIGLFIVRKDESGDYNLLINQICSVFDNEKILNYNMGVSRVFNDIAKTNLAYRQAIDSIEEGFIKKDSKISYFDKLSKNNNYIYPIKLHKQFIDYVKSNRKQELEKIIINMKKYFDNNTEVSVREMRKTLFLIISELTNTLFYQEGFYSELLGEAMDICININSYSSVNEIIKTIYDFSIRYMKIIENLNHSDISEIIEDVVNYIKVHYSENLSLNFVADRYYVNPSYLSQMFKKHTGKGFIEYITMTRINKAKELLVTTDNKVNKVGEMVGYTNYRYFRKLFKKHNGITPTECRKRGREN